MEIPTVCLAVILLTSLVAAKDDNLIIMVKEGKLKGSTTKLLDGSLYFSFKGVPYAQPPLGDLRFRAPLPVSPWIGMREATEHGPICSQYDLNTNQLTGSEDCLYLNVYTKSLKQNAKIPVMVYIYGGGFMSGSGNQGSYGPEFLLQHNVVMVTMNYRLEVLGFLSLDTPEVPGNAGMKDQVVALQWVKENIAKFGGDPDNVTIFGESAGSVAVTYHIISPMSRGLFHKAIAQSGVCIDDSGLATDAKERAFRVAKVLGKETTDTQDLLKFLRSVPASLLSNVTYVTETTDEKLRGIPMRFGPVVEKKFEGNRGFLSEDPLKMMFKSINKVPLIIGYNSAEGLIMLKDQLSKAESLNANSSFLVPRELVLKITKSKMEEFGHRIMEFYTGRRGIGNDTAQGVVNLRTDMHFAYNIHRFVHFYSKLGMPVFLYRFDYATELNVVKNFLGLSNMPGACHADDLFYFFYTELNKAAYASQERLRRFVFELTKLWTDFAKTGNPTPDGCSVKWERYTSAGREYLALNEVMSPSRRAEADRMEMWNQMYCEAAVPCIAV